MQIEISFKGMNGNDEMKTFVESKTAKLKKYFDGKIHVVWNLTAENDEVTSHAHVLGNNMEFFGEAADSNYMSSVESCVSKVEAQLRKRKEQITDHHK